MNQPDKDKFMSYFIWISLIILAISIPFPFIVKLFLADWSKSGTFGDTYGALNAIFSGITVAGLIITILMQRNELGNQKKEMQDTRREFSINRITGVIYNQLERYERAVENLIIINNNEEFKGYDAMFFLDSQKQTVFHGLGTTEEEILQETRAKNVIAMKLYVSNDKALHKFAMTAYNSISAVKECLYISELNISEMNDLKNLFFRNIGNLHLGRIEDISNKYLEHHELCKDDDFMNEYVLDSGKISLANIYLKSISKFRNTVITDDSLAHVKKNWQREFGDHA
jgi:hypothetical protein